MKKTFYCHKQGHLIADCPVLKRKQQAQRPKTVALLKTKSPPELQSCTDVLDMNYKFLCIMCI